MFVVLKTFDVAAKDSRQRFPAIPADDYRTGWDHAVREALHEALSHVQPQAVQLVHEEHLSINANCVSNGSNKTASSNMASPAGLLRHIGQMQASLDCLRMIEAHEQTYGIRFSLVTRSRPDIAFLAPVPSFCTFTWTNAYISQKDYLYFMRREDASVLLSVISHYRSCVGHPWWKYGLEELLRGALSRKSSKGTFMSASSGSSASRLVQLDLPIAIARVDECPKQACEGGAPRIPNYVSGCCISGLGLGCGDVVAVTRACRQVLAMPSFAISSRTGTFGFACAGS